MPGPTFLDTGFGDPYAFQATSPSAASTWYARAQALGSSYVRLAVTWSAIAPASPGPNFHAADASDPSYSWSALDSAVEGAVAQGQQVVMTLVNAPTWALGARAPNSAPGGTWRPSPSALGAFAHAVAERYSGHYRDPRDPSSNLPKVGYFQVWNEPNLPSYLTPQWTRNGKGAWIPASAYFYRRMLNAAYDSIKAVQPHAVVLAAGTAPYGDPPGVDRMAPVVFLRALLCLSGSHLRLESCPNPAHFDALDHHPYGLIPTLHAHLPDDVAVPDFGRLQAILRVAEHTARVLPAGPKPIWVTEISWSSNPPDPHAIPAARQARYLALAFYELWRQGVSHVFWYLIRDYPYKNLTGSGVYFGTGTSKPSARAFAFPFVAVPAGGANVTLWGRAPRSGVVTIEGDNGRGWSPVLQVTTTHGGVFYRERQPARYRLLRARIGPATSLAWANG